MDIKIKFINFLNKIIRHQNWYKVIFRDSIKFWYNVPFDIDVVNLGSNSSKYAFSYETLPIKGMNWALGPQSLAHDFNVLKNYSSFLKEGATVFITLCPFSSLISTYSIQHNLKYYTFLHPATIIDFKEEERVKALMLKQAPIKYYPVLCIKNFIKESILAPKRIIQLLIKKRVNYSKHAESFIKMWMDQFKISDLNSHLSEKHLNEQNHKALLLNEMIQFCCERNLKPVLVIPPMHPALSSKFSEEFRQNYIYSFIEKANTHNITLLNYLESTDFTEDKYYRNSFFMSDRGAKKFTKQILTDCGIIK